MGSGQRLAEDSCGQLELSPLRHLRPEKLTDVACRPATLAIPWSDKSATLGIYWPMRTLSTAKWLRIGSIRKVT